MAFNEETKAKVRRRAHFMCCLCKAMGVEVHHIVPQAERGSDAADNAAPLCPSCHETYGANPAKRKFIREARDHWYEICQTRYASDPDRLDELKELMKRAVTYEDFQSLKQDILDTFGATLQTPRTEAEILGATERLFDQIWFNRHLILRSKIERGIEKVDAKVWKVAQDAAKRVGARIPSEDRPPYDNFEWGMLNGKLSALRWVLGDEWDFLDT
jgi:hypothetical protein